MFDLLSLCLFIHLPVPRYSYGPAARRGSVEHPGHGLRLVERRTSHHDPAHLAGEALAYNIPLTLREQWASSTLSPYTLRRTRFVAGSSSIPCHIIHRPRDRVWVAFYKALVASHPRPPRAPATPTTDGSSGWVTPAQLGVHRGRLEGPRWRRVSFPTTPVTLSITGNPAFM